MSWDTRRPDDSEAEEMKTSILFYKNSVKDAKCALEEDTVAVSSSGSHSFVSSGSHSFVSSGSHSFVSSGSRSFVSSGSLSFVSSGSRLDI
jgi:hypothetical protein